jgi:hypothetical protein
MKNLPNNPHAIIEIDRGAGGLLVLDSWASRRRFQKVTAELVTNETSQAEWTLFDPKFKVIDDFSGNDVIQNWIVRVFLGYGANLGEPIFKGLLAQVERGESTTTFRAFDMGWKMKIVKKAGYKNKKDDLAILRQLAKDNGLLFEGPDKPLRLEPNNTTMQDEQTDWEHAMERAQAAGLVIFVRQDTLFAKYPAKVGTPSLTLQNKKDFVLQLPFDFNYKTPENLDGRPRVIKRRARGKAGKRIEGESDSGPRGRVSVILKRDVPRATKKKLTKRAQAQKELEREHAFESNVSIVFPPQGERLDVRNTVELVGVGKLFSGKYLANTVTYYYEPGKLDLQLGLYRDINV